MSASVTYKDEIITTVKNTSKDLLTSGKYLEDDITITDITSLQAKSNISPTTSSQTVSADAGYDGLSSVQINAIPSDYIGTDIPRRSSISVSQDNNTIHVEDGYYEDDIDTSMGACTVTGASVLIDSQGDATGSIIVGRGGYINSGSHAFYVDDVVTPRSSSDLTASGATVSVPYGYYPADASKTVASGSAGTPTATKGTVSNHAVNVTPSVTNTTGYITGGTKTGTAVTVSASELDSGTKSITANGNSQDVVGYASVDVSVPNSYSASDEGKVVSSGALVVQTAHADVTPTTSDQTIDTTINNSIKVKGDADLVAGNIKKDVEIFGVTGSYEGGGGGVDLSWLAANTPTPSVRNFFYALVNGTAEHGEFTLSSTPTSFVTAFTMTNFGESNLPQGIIFVDKDFYQGITTLASQASEAFAFCWLDKAFTRPADDSSDPPVYNAFRSMVNQNGTNASVARITFDGTTEQFRAKWQFSGNSLQVKHSYNNNNQYCAFLRNRTYIWIAY